MAGSVSSARASDCASTCSGRRDLYSRATVTPSMMPAADSAPDTPMVPAKWPHMNEPAARPPKIAVWYSARARAFTQSGTSIWTVVL
ncbi:hypothetical protein D3C85_1466590 [compost metagenome]